MATFTLPTNFADMSITETTGKVTVGTNDDKTGYDLAADQSAVTVGTVTTLTGHTAQTGDSYARLGAPTGSSISADVAAVKTDTGNLVTRITSTLFSGITSMAEWLGLIAGKQTGDATARTEIRATGGGSGTYDESTDSLEAIRERGDSAWITGVGGGGGSSPTVEEIRTEMDNNSTKLAAIVADTNELQSDDIPATLSTIAGYLDTEIAAIKAVTDLLPDAGALSSLATTSALTTVDNEVGAIQADLDNATDGLGALKTLIDALQSAVDGQNDLSAAEVNAEVDTALADYDAPTKAELDAGLAALNDLTAAQVNAEVDTALSDYDAPTKAELDAGLAALNDLDAAGIRTAIGLVAANLDTQIAGLDTLIDSIIADLANGVDGLGALKTLIDAIQTAIDNQNDLSAAEVNAEVVDVVRTDTETELSAVPAASPSLHAMIQLLYMALRNKVDVTATTKEIHNDAGAVIGTKTLSDDGTTYSESEAV